MRLSELFTKTSKTVPADEPSKNAQLLIRAAGPAKLIDHAQAERTSQDVGQPLAGWFSFQPLWDKITAEQPDLLG